MKLMIITHAYAPMLYPRAFRWASIAEDWVKQGHDVDVVCGWEPGLKFVEELNGVRVHRLESFVLRFLQKKQAPSQNVQNPEPKKKTTAVAGLKKMVRWVYERTWKKVYWPDYACLWYFPAVQKVKKLMLQNEYDGVFSVSLPFTGHLVALFLKRKLNTLPWVADIGDPFSFQEHLPVNNYGLYHKRNHRYEGLILEKADAISVTTAPVVDAYTNLFPIDKKKFAVIPPLISPSKPSSKQAGPFFSSSGKYRIVYIGMLYPHIRTPNFLLKSFEKLLDTPLSKQLELHFIGQVTSCLDSFAPYEHFLDKKIFLHGQVPHELALQAMHEADVLVNIGNGTPFQLPSKVVEYASTGKAILNIAKTQVDSSIAFFKTYDAALNLVEQDFEPTPEQLMALVAFLEQKPQLASEELDAWIRRFEISSVSSSYLDLLRVV